MRHLITAAVLGLAILALPASGPLAKMENKGGMAHAHIGHVMKGWKDTPEGKGLLPTAVTEAGIAAQHAGFAAKQPDNLGWMKTHTRHVLHAVDPATISKGPGRGYGVLRAAGGAAKHIGFAADSDGASKNVKLHTVHVKTSLANTVARAQEIVKLGKAVLAAGSAAEAAPLVRKIRRLSAQLSAGRDANGDGRITWKKNEGGLAEAEKHMGFMMKGEGI